jgi:microcystin-dependent protein
VPSGTIVAYAGKTAPPGWLLCDGAAVSRTADSALFTALGTDYGPGDGINTFNVPDLRGRTALGGGTGSGLTARSNGQRAGAESATLTVAQLPAHSHTITDPGHAHGAAGANVFITAGGPAGTNPGVGLGSSFNYTAATTSSTTGITGTNNTGGGSPVSIMPPFQVVTFIIKI